MADYYPLLTRALDALADSSSDTRRTVYERARGALLGQLRALDPPLSDADLARERRALEEAIDRIETEHGGSASARGEPGFDKAPAGASADLAAHGSDAASTPDPKPAAPAPIRKPRVAQARTPIAPGRDAVEGAGSAGPFPPRERPRIETVSANPGLDPGRRRSLILGTVLLVLVAAVAVAAWLLRDQPGDMPQTAISDAPSPGEGQGKLADRVGIDRAAGGSGPGAVTGATATAAGGSGAQGRSELAVAQRAIFYEENPSEGQTPKAMSGRAVWRVDAVNAGQGQPLDTVVRSTVEVPEAGVTLDLTIRRNLDATLPASHTIELAFATTGQSNRSVRDVGLMEFKTEEAQRGTRVSGLVVPVKENYFLIGLSNLKGDVERNTDLILHRNWVDVPLRLTTGKRAVLSFEKGVPGDRVLNEAFSQWR